MLNDDFCLGYSILGNMIVQQGSVLFKQDQIPLGFIFFFDIYFYQILICLAAETRSFVLQDACSHVN